MTVLDTRPPGETARTEQTLMQEVRSSVLLFCMAIVATAGVAGLAQLAVRLLG